LQSSAAATLKNLIENDQKMLDVDREDFIAFFRDDANYALQSGAITGIFKKMQVP